jgi:hypothetical protein
LARQKAAAARKAEKAQGRKRMDLKIKLSTNGENRVPECQKKKEKIRKKKEREESGIVGELGRSEQERDWDKFKLGQRDRCQSWCCEVGYRN